MSNVAVINLEVHSCAECPFVRNYANRKGYTCTKVRRGKDRMVTDETIVPDDCWFVLERLRNAVESFRDLPATTIPKKYIGQVEKKQKEKTPDPKFGADHGWRHIERVRAIGNEFLESCHAYGIIPLNSLQKYRYLFYLAASMHDIGLADTVKNHAAHSAELARKYFQKIDIDPEDVEAIIHAIIVHSDGECANSILDAALIIADKVDVTGERIVRVTDDITRECSKIVDAKFEIKGVAGTSTTAELSYTTDGSFDTEVFLERWAKGVALPKRIATEILEIPEFKFIVDGKEIDIKWL